MQPSGEIGRFEMVDLPSPPADRRRYPTEDSGCHLSIARLLLLTSVTAAACAVLRACPPVGIFLISMLPCLFVAAFWQTRVTKTGIVAFGLASIPLYVASSGPAYSVSVLVGQFWPALYDGALRLHETVYPDTMFCNPDWIPGRRLIVYVHQWYELTRG